MKTIDVLVEELPKRGGWPEKASHAVYAKRFSRVCFTVGGAPAITGDDVSIFEDDGAGHGVFWLPGALLDCEEPIDYATAIITREQYEAALAEKEHPLPWGEKNKPCPTIGAECRGFPDCGRRASCASDDITDDAVRAEMGMNSRALDAALAAKNEGWIEWRGGRCPVDDVTEVDIKFLAGGIVYGVEAGKYYWPRTGQEYDIIAYRLHKPQEAEQAEADEEADLNECIGQDATPVWNGEGLPPVGVECEIQFIKDTPPQEWFSFKLIGMHDEIVIVTLDGENTWRHISKFSPDKVTFRPIRSEAERKRDESLRVIYEILDAGTSTKQDAADIYDAIAAGKIPGVTLDD